MKGLFGGVYNGKRVLVTGHTGFKGSWLSLWLDRLGADVAGYSIGIPSKPSHFEVARLRKRITHVAGDVRDLRHLKKVFDDFSPEVVFHLAAQALARHSYDTSQETFDTNLMGTVNVLECLRATPSIKAAVFVTSDKCYQNVERDRGYAEDDALGGDDPYSASKACAEMAARAYYMSFFRKSGTARIATARAGNVIGGGDWAKERIIPDCVRALSIKEVVSLRNPEATRPWQHVLEPLGGYLFLGEHLLKRPNCVNGQAFNFGPSERAARPVREVIELFFQNWGGGRWRQCAVKDGKKESKLLQLRCGKALSRLGWRSVLNFNECIALTADWYREYYGGARKMDACSGRQIDEYVAKAADRRLPWAAGRVR